MDDDNKNKRLLELFAPHAKFAQVFFDGFVLVDAETRILKSNKFFSRLTGVPANLLPLASSLEEIMRLEICGVQCRIKGLIDQPRPTRIDELRGITGKMQDHILTVSVYPFRDQDIFLGAFLMIRDVSLDNELQSQYQVKSMLSVTDALTGLYNRSYFQKYLPAQFIKDRDIPGHREERQMSVVMIDIDHFKKTNDTFGHLAGDFVIKEVARILKSQSRATDIICRYGGEEFLAILPDTGLKGAIVVAEKFRKEIEDTVFNFEGKIIPTAISSGVASIDFSVDTVELSLARADEALYHSKHNGRNRTTAHDGQALTIATATPALIRKIS